MSETLEKDHFKILVYYFKITFQTTITLKENKIWKKIKDFN